MISILDMKKIYWLSLLCFVILFYAEAHLNEERQAFLVGFTADGAPYDWAGMAIAIWTLVCTLLALVAAYYARSMKPWIGRIFGGISLVALSYAVFVLMHASQLETKEIVYVLGPYAILGVWWSMYMSISSQLETE